MTDPRVASVAATAYTVPTDQPEADGTIAWDHTTVVVVEARAEDAVGTGWTFAPASGAHVVADVLAPVVEGRSALAPATAQAAMVRAVRNAGRVGLVGTAISAVDIALWDLGARLQDIPLTRWWGVEPRPVPVYGSGGFTTYSDGDLRAQLAGWVDQGIPRVKIKIGESWGSCERRDLERTALARRVVGHDVELYVDANGGYTAGQAVRMGRRFDDLGVRWFEEPVSSDDLAGLATVRAGVTADVTAGEYGYDLATLARLAPVVDCLQVDVTRCGGYTEWFRVAAVAAAHGLDVSAHCAPYLTAPVAAATPRLRHLEWFHDHVRIARELVEGYADPVDGALLPLDGPGHGLRLRREAAERYRVA
ncbi:enolase C-terminal domain-like protein [Nocardioides sp. CER19]|uniref:enolase C-terminal domain-like protein n=1 Tax=Nocardioides sp. CER19 TaxID=3038538 RepID=UPI00244D13D5|nr:enolase C-terminal domain-like protein [Nocardioides sp. CER19]MDH2416015.1 enolase C-terminal domain-like protein [Nocardioides sp. CER19]